MRRPFVAAAIFAAGLALVPAAPPGAAAPPGTASPAAPAGASEARHVFFLHHSTGRNLIADGEVRALIKRGETELGVDLRFWDHDYNYAGLTDPDGELHEDWNYGIPGDNTDPIGLHQLWTGVDRVAAAARDSMLLNHDVIAFKSCYTASYIPTDEDLAQYRRWYLEIRTVLDRHPRKIFVVISPPPRHPLAEPADLPLAERLAQADRARAFARWLGSDEFLGGHPNLVFFDLFDHLAHPDDGTAERNQLRAEYARYPDVGDSHPNRAANEAIGTSFAEVLLEAGRRPLPAVGASWGGLRGLYR